MGTQTGKEKSDTGVAVNRTQEFIVQTEGGKGRGRTKVTQKASPVWPLASGAPSGSS